jgi:hypothetical protein
MFYNRWGWVGITLVFLFILEPRTQNRTVLALDSVCLAALLFFLFYLKISYSGLATAFLGVMFISSPYNRRVSVAAFVLFVAAVGVMELRYGLNIPYLKDLYLAVKASGASRGTMVPKLISNIREFALAAAAVAMAWSELRSKWSYIAYAGFVMLAGLAIIDQNTHQYGVICLLSLLAVSYELIRRNIGSATTSETEYQVGRIRAIVCLGLIVLFTVQSIFNQFAAIAMFRSGVTQVAVERPGGLNGMLFSDDLWDHFCRGKVRELNTNKIIPTTTKSSAMMISSKYLAGVEDGIALLERAGVTGKRVAVLDFVDPFSFILNLPPAAGVHTCNGYGRTMGDNVYTPAEEYLGNADYVVIPKVPIDKPTTDFLLRIYGEYQKANFEPAETTEFWELWKRRESDKANAL